MLHPLESFKPLGTVEAGIVAFPERASLPTMKSLTGEMRTTTKTTDNNAC